MLKTLALVLCMTSVMAGRALAQTCAAYPNILANTNVADATQVMANFNCAALLGAAHFTGNVGILTTSPLATLQVGAGGTTTALYVDSNVSGAASFAPSQGAWIEWNASPGYGMTAFVNNEGGGTGGWQFVNTNNVGTVLATPMTIQGGGNVGIGTSFPSAKLNVDPAGAGTILVGNANTTSGGYTSLSLGISAQSGGYGSIQSIQSAGSAFGALVLNAGGGSVGVATTTPAYLFTVNGSAGGTSAWNVISDARLKTHIVEITDALDKVEHLRGVTFDWKPQRERSVGKALALPVGEKQIGFIAQEVAAVAPEAVTAPADPSKDVYAMRDGALMALAIEAIKQQQAEIEELRAQIAALQKSHTN